MGDHLADNADKVRQGLDFTIASVPFIITEPRVRSSTPLVVTASQTSHSVVFAIDGAWLANGTPKLILGGTECKAANLAEPKASFDCPPAAFSKAAPSGVRYVTGTFSAVQQLTFFEKLGGLFGAAPRMKTYPISIAVVPDKFGHFNVDAMEMVGSVESNTRSAAYDTGSQHCTWGSETTQNESPAGPDWNIEVRTINLVLESGEYSELRSVIPNGFQVYAGGHNHGNCVKVFGQVVSYDARGWAAGHISWTETRATQTVEKMPLDEGDLPWGNTKVIPLPAGASKLYRERQTV